MRLKLRLASNTLIEAELARVLEFYRQNPHPMVRERAPTILGDAIGRSSLLLLEEDDSKIVGVCVQLSHANGMYSETGGVRILVNGFGLQAIMMGICSINEYIFAPPTHKIFAITADDNIPSLKNIEKAGFILWKGDEEFLNTMKYGSQFPPDKRLFQFNLQRVRRVRDQLIKLVSCPLLRRPEKDVTLLLEHPLFRPANLALMEQI
jgi:hypothetical protein